MTDFHRWKTRLDATGRYPIENGPPYLDKDGNELYPGGPYSPVVDNGDGTWSIWIVGAVLDGETKSYIYALASDAPASGGASYPQAGPASGTDIATGLAAHITAAAIGDMSAVANGLEVRIVSDTNNVTNVSCRIE